MLGAGGDEQLSLNLLIPETLQRTPSASLFQVGNICMRNHSKNC